MYLLKLWDEWRIFFLFSWQTSEDQAEVGKVLTTANTTEIDQQKDILWACMLKIQILLLSKLDENLQITIALIGSLTSSLKGAPHDDVNGGREKNWRIEDPNDVADATEWKYFGLEVSLNANKIGLFSLIFAQDDRVKDFEMLCSTWYYSK